MTTKSQLINLWREKKVDEKLLDAFHQIPREHFIPHQLMEDAYEDHPLPTVRNQSISQPSTIIMMLQALEIEEGEKVLEVGAGAGYQAAIISKIIGDKGKLITIDIIPELIHMARENLNYLNITNVDVHETDGGEGFMEEAPFDRVIITAACPTIPQPIIDQLREGGVIVAPVGDLQSQTMVRGVKENGKIEIEFLGPFRFVPMRGKHGFSDVEIVNR